MRLSIFIFAFITSLSIFAAPSKPASENIQNFQMTISLPVDHTSNPKYSLSAEMPKDFKSIQPVESFLHTPLIECIPVTDTLDNWSEMIGSTKHSNVQVGAKEFTELMKQQCMRIVKQVTCCTESHSIISVKNSTIKKSEMIIKYTLPKTRSNPFAQEEIFGVVCYSGPFDSAAVLYSIRLKPGQTADECVAKIQNFFEKNVKLFSF